MFYLAAPRHKLLLQWPVSRSAFGRDVASVDFSLQGWEAISGHGLAGGGKDRDQGWQIFAGGIDLQTQGKQRRKQLRHG